MTFLLKSFAVLGFVALVWAASAVGQTASQTSGPERIDRSAVTAADSASDDGLPGSINGTIVDESGAVVAGARVALSSGDASPNQSKEQQEALSGSDGQFFFPKVTPGAFTLTITAAGFATRVFSGTIKASEVQTVPQVALSIADTRTEVRVSLTQVEVAEEQIKVEEKQRVMGIVPNFYISYIPDAAPLTAKQKFQLAFRTMIDPFTVVIAGGVAGIEQAQNHFAEYGQGAQGYGKRLGASYADATTGTLIGAAIFPALLKQDPRYFYKGTGSTISRALYAIANSLICRGDNKRWQPNYSNILGGLAAGGISNLYYPEQDRNGVGLTFENAAIGIGSTAIGNLFQEFVIRKLTPKAPKQN